MMYLKSDNDSIEVVSEILKKGKIAILPTDTVYGFSGIVDSVNSIDEKIRKIKGREKKKPFIQLISSPHELKEYTNDVIPEKLLSLWPGPLTIIVNDLHNTTTAFRCPGDEWLRKVIKSCGCPIYSTSVNRSGESVLNTINEIEKEFSNDVSVIVSDGDKLNGVPSTIVKIENGQINIIRQGTVII